MKKIWDTLTSQQKNDLLSGTPVGFFPHLILSNDAFYSIISDLCLGYYTLRSGEKTVSPFYNKIISNSANVNGVTEDEIIGTFIRSKFIDKWSKVYEALVNAQYNVLDEFDKTHTKNGNNTNTITHNTVKNKDGENSDITTFDTDVVDDGKTGMYEVTIRNTENADDVYGYNTNYPVGDTVSNELQNEINIGDKEKNTTHNSSKKTGTESKVFGINESETYTGTDTTTFNIGENEEFNGRNVSASKLIEEELNLRNRQIFFDIVYKDIDSVVALQIYI